MKILVKEEQNNL